MSKIIFTFLFIFPLASGVLQPTLLTKKNRSKVEKLVKKVWKNEAISLERISGTAGSESAISKNLFSIKNETQTLGYLSLRRVHGCKIGGCSEGGDNSGFAKYISNFDESSYETFDYLMVLDSDFTIQKIAVIDYPGDHGYEVSSKRWLRQFQGYNGAEKMKYGREVDAISGATISGNSITEDVQSTYEKVLHLIKK